MDTISASIRFLQFYGKASTVFDLHSPLAYSFANAVLEDRRHFYVFSEAETLRREMIRDLSTLQVEDFGAGSTILKSRERTISDLAKKVATPPLFCRWLFHIVRFGHPSAMLEMGTSLGISAIYQSAAAPHAKFITLEGCEQTAQVAKKAFKRVKCKAELLTGRFDQQLPRALAGLGRLDHLYLDGDHSLEGTLRYLELCMPFTHPGTIWVIGDIHWSAEMETAWDRIRAMPGVQMTFDLFGMGVVLFKPVTPKAAHFAVVPSLWKPWRRGRWGGL